MLSVPSMGVDIPCVVCFAGMTARAHIRCPVAKVFPIARAGVRWIVGAPSTNWYAVVIGLIARMRKIKDGMNAFKWLINNAPPEWVQLYSSDLFKVMREKKMIDEFKKELMNQKEIMKHINKLKSLLDY